MKIDRFNAKLVGDTDAPPEVKEALVSMAQDFYRAGGMMSPEYWFDLTDDSKAAFLEAHRRLVDELLATEPEVKQEIPA